MLVQRVDPVGVDIIIDLVQKDLYNELTLNFVWTGYESYDRAYRNRRGQDTIPEVYTSKGNYEEVLFNDRKTVTSFFLTGEKRIYDSAKFVFEQDVSLIFQANLDKLYPGFANRADEKLIDDVCKAIKHKGWENRLTEIITGVDNVYSSLKVGYDKKYFDDMSNFFIVRFNFSIPYINNDCITQALK